MQLGRVLGTATSTVKHPTFQGERLLVVQLEAAGWQPDGEPVLAFDRLGAGRGDAVLVTNDGAAFRSMLGRDTPGPLERDGAARRDDARTRAIDVDAAVRGRPARSLAGETVDRGTDGRGLRRPVARAPARPRRLRRSGRRKSGSRRGRSSRRSPATC